MCVCGLLLSVCVMMFYVLMCVLFEFFVSVIVLMFDVCNCDVLVMVIVLLLRCGGDGVVVLVMDGVVVNGFVWCMWDVVW